MLRLYAYIACVLAASLIAACATRQYQAKPINIEAISSQLATKDVTNPAFQQHLLEHGYPASFDTWGLDELTLIALYFHPKLAVAKAELAQNQAAESTATIKAPPTLNAQFGHSNLRNGDTRPWAYGLSVDIPIQTSDKRALVGEQAHQQTELARLDVADTAWRLRSQIAVDLTRYQQHLATAQHLQEELNTREEIAAMLQKRLQNGLAASTEVLREQLSTTQTGAALMHETQRESELLAVLAADVGLSSQAFSALKLRTTPLEYEAIENDMLNRSLQASVLLNRVDMRRALTQYEMAETQLRLEIAKQYSDFSISPGLAFEFGDTIWSLGLSSLLNFVQHNDRYINAAERLRDVEGAKVKAQQVQIIAQLQQSHAQVIAALRNQTQAQQQVVSQQTLWHKLEKQFDQGLIDRLTLRQAQLNVIAAQQQFTQAQFETRAAIQQLEQAMQTPLDSALPMLETKTP